MPVEDLIAHAHLQTATCVLEFGCGTGRVAAELLARHLPDACRYVGIDISPVMVGLASERLRAWRPRAGARLVSGSGPLPMEDGSCSHVLSTYVLDYSAPRRPGPWWRGPTGSWPRRAASAW